MLELDRTQFYLAAHLTNGRIHYPESEGVIRGHSPGRVFVDRLNEPQAAFVWVRGQSGFYLLGDPNQKGFLAKVDYLIDTDLAPYLQAHGIGHFEFSADDSAWNPVIEAIFAKRELQSEYQSVYLLDQPRWCEIEDRALATPINATFLASPLGKDQFLVKKLLDCWSSYDQFLAKGLGNCLVCSDRIASLCLSGYAAGQKHAIVVETLHEYRQQGFAKLVAAALLEQYQQRGITAHWDVMPTNRGSIALAEALGFAKSYAYQVYYFAL